MTGQESDFSLEVSQAIDVALDTAAHTDVDRDARADVIRSVNFRVNVDVYDPINSVIYPAAVEVSR